MATRVVVSLGGEIMKEVLLERPVTVFGRHPHCDVVLDHPSVSLRHALFRIENRTIYIEDLASTNGTLANSLPVTSRVLHHLDLVEIGLYKVHVFDDALLGGKVGDLEETVLTAYESTVFAPLPEEPPPALPLDLDDLLERTDPAYRLGAQPAPAPTPTPTPTPDDPGEDGPFVLRVIAGPGRGSYLSLKKANTMVGQAPGDTALVVRRGSRLYLSQFGARRRPRLNGVEIGPSATEIRARDRFDVGGSEYEVVQWAGDDTGRGAT